MAATLSSRPSAPRRRAMPSVDALLSRPTMEADLRGASKFSVCVMVVEDTRWVSELAAF